MQVRVQKLRSMTALFENINNYLTVRKQIDAVVVKIHIAQLQWIACFDTALL